MSTACFAAGSITGHITDQRSQGLYETEIFACRTGATANTAYWRCWTNGYYELTNLTAGTHSLGINDPFHFRPRLRSFVPVQDNVTTPGQIRMRSTYYVTGADIWAGTPLSTEIRQTFKSTGGSVSKITVWMSDWKNLNCSVHDAATNAQIGPTRLMGQQDRGTAKWVYGEVPLIAGKTYYVKLRMPDSSQFGVNCTSNLGQDIYPDGQAFYNGNPQANVDIKMTIECDDDGLATMYQRPGTNAGDSGGELGQTFKALGSYINLVSIHATGFGSSGTDVTFSIHQGGPGGAQVGVSKTMRVRNYQPMGQWAVCSWQPGEVPVVPGQTYYLKMTSSGFYLFANSNNPYSDGAMYVNGVQKTGWDMCGTIAGEVSLNSSICTIQGTVVDANGVPVSGAVVATTNFGYKATTAANGTYSLQVTGDIYDLTCSKQGYLSQSITAFNAECGTVKTLNWTIPIPGRISGYVRDAGGVGIVGASVTANPGGYTIASSTGGYYNLTNLPPGNYNVTACKTNYICQTVNGVAVTQGGNTTINFNLQPQTTLLNPGFEETNASNDPLSWTKYGHGLYVRTGTGYAGIVPHSGQRYATNEASWTDPKNGGVYQTVGVVPNVPITGSVYVVCYGTGGGAANTLARIGLDPTGGTNPASASVQWSPWYNSPSDGFWEWTRLSKTIITTGNWLTVFLDMRQNPNGAYAFPLQVNAYDDVTLGVTSDTVTIAEGKQRTDETYLYCGPGVITAKFTGTPGDFFYIEDSGRATGIRVNGTTSHSVGDSVRVVGPIRTVGGERYIQGDVVQLVQAGVGALNPLGLTNSALGGSANGLVPGIPDASGLNNIGLLVKVWGRVTSIDSTSFQVSDGSGDSVKVIVPAGVSVPPGGSYAVVTGISSTQSVGGIQRLVMAVPGGITSY